MATTKPRFMITVSDEIYQAVEDYRFSSRCKSQTQAAVSLIERGLNAINNKSEGIKKEPAFPGELTDKERSFLMSFSSLSPLNRRVLLAVAEVLLREQEEHPGSPR